MKLFITLATLFVCGSLALPTNDVAPQIIGGRDATPHEAPYIVSVQVNRGGQGYGHTCGGSILSASWILTAAHCYTENQPLTAPLRIVAGEHDFYITSGIEQVRLTPNVVIHEDYTGGVAPYDIALMETETPLELTTGIVETISLPTPGSIPTGDVQLFGWGSISMTETADIPDILQTVHKDILSLELCREVLYNKYPLGTPLHYTNVCTGPLNSVITACSGDSGGPIVQGSGDSVSFHRKLVGSFFYPPLFSSRLSAWRHGYRLSHAVPSTLSRSTSARLLSTPGFWRELVRCKRKSIKGYLK